MMLILGVSLFTVRIVLKTLGAEDYGIYNVVGGIVAMLGFFTSTMTSASLRFFTFELGRKDLIKLNQYFKLTILLYLSFGIIVFILAETIGLWFLMNKMAVPENRITAALWIYEFSIVSFILNMFVVPYNSIIIAHEEMDLYAYVSIIEAILKLLIIYILMNVKLDKLEMYGALLFLVTLVTSSFYISYCSIKFKECKISAYWNKNMFNELISYSGWSLFGALADMIRNQGINIMLNIFFNPIINAARAIAFQINNSINLFVTNFYQAVRPQITKQYAASQYIEMMKLVFNSSRYCYYLIMVLAIPTLLETPYILSVWLKVVPDYTILFTRLIVITTMIESISYPLMTAVSATGKIKIYQIVTGGLLILNLPISYIVLRMGFAPQSTIYVAMVLALTSQVSRVLFMQKIHNMSVKSYVTQIIIIIICVTFLSLIIPFLIYKNMQSSLERFIIITIIAFFNSLAIIYLIGITKNERKLLNTFIKQLKTKYFKQ